MIRVSAEEQHKGAMDGCDCTVQIKGQDQDLNKGSRSRKTENKLIRRRPSSESLLNYENLGKTVKPSNFSEWRITIETLKSSIWGYYRCILPAPLLFCFVFFESFIGFKRVVALLPVESISRL
ncbi:hypothetical protein OROMI_023928 [Orobanche minor]